MSKVKIVQVKSLINRPKNQKSIIKALGLGRINKTVEVEKTPQIAGMLEKISHLVVVEEVV